MLATDWNNRAIITGIYKEVHRPFEPITDNHTLYRGLLYTDIYYFEEQARPK